MHIIVVGAGIAGLTVYLGLRKHLPNATVTIIERHRSSAASGIAQDDSPSTYGGGLGVSPNGMRVLRHLCHDLHARVTREGFPVDDFEFRSAGGTSLGLWPANSIMPTLESTVMMQRKSLWAILSEAVGYNDVDSGVEVEWVTPDGEVILADGRTLKADLIIGADGVRSMVRASILDKGEPALEPDFQNIMNQGGTFQTSVVKAANLSPHVVMTFGPTGFFGYTPMTTAETSEKTGPQAGSVSMWWSSYSVPPSETPSRTTNNPHDPFLVDVLQSRHGSWKDPVISKVVTELKEQHTIDTASLNLYTPTWVIPKLPRWTRGRIVLIGDAAHALPSTSGQGASQAFADAIALAIMLAGRATPHDEAVPLATIEQVLSKFERMRKPRVDKILDASLRMQGTKRDLGWLETKMMYAFMWVMLKVGSSAIVAQAFDYDVVEEARHFV